MAMQKASTIFGYAAQNSISSPIWADHPSLSSSQEAASGRLSRVLDTCVGKIDKMGGSPKQSICSDERLQMGQVLLLLRGSDTFRNEHGSVKRC